MSKIGKIPISIPPDVTVTLTGNQVSVKGPNGILSAVLPLIVTQDGIQLSVPTTTSHLSGLTRTLLANMISGVSRNWSKTLELSGTGYRAVVADSTLQLALGFSHPVQITAPAGITFEAKDNKIKVTGPDKSLVGQIAAQIRGLRPADVYKHKGFKYEGEVLITKAGKAAKAGSVPTGK